MPLRHRQILLPAHAFSKPSHTDNEQRHRDGQIHDVVHDDLLLAGPEDVAQLLDDEHRLVPHEAVVALGEGRRADLAVPLPLVALGDDDVRAVEGQDLVLVQRLGEARARGGDLLCAGSRSVIEGVQEGCMLTLIASGSARRSMAEGEGSHRTYAAVLSQYML